MLKHIHVEGTDYECGFQFGKVMQQSVQHRLEIFIPEVLFQRCEKDLPAIHTACKKTYPRFLDHLRGIAEGAEVDYWHLFLLNCAEMRDAKGCTTIADVNPERAILSHNEDTGSHEEHREDCPLVTYHLKDMTFTSFTYAGELPGSAYNWNSHGLFFSVNYLDPLRPDPDLNRIPRDFTARAVAEAKDIEDAVRIIRASPDASGYHYYIGQGKRIVSVEQFLDDVSVKEITGIDAHANHYIHPQFATGAPYAENSLSRQKRADELIQKHETALHILTDRENAPLTICRTSDDKGLTLSTVQFRSLEKKVVIYTPLTLEKEYEFEF